MSKIKIYIMSFVILFTFLFRINGTFYGSPFFLVGDEYSLVGGTLKLLELKTIFPVLHPPEKFQILIYPMLIPYLYLVLYAPYILYEFVNNSFSINQFFISNLIENLHYFLIISRFSSALISTLTVVVVYLIAKSIFKSFYVAIFCSLLISFDWITVITSHFARHWNLTTLIVWTGIMLAMYVKNNENKKYYIWTGILSGLGYGTSYIFGSLAILPLIFAHIFKYKSAINKFKKLIISILIFLIFVIFFTLVNPYPLERLLFTNVTPINSEKSFFIYFQSFLFYFKILFISNPSLVVLSILGLLSSLFIKNSKHICLLILVSILSYIFLLSNIVADEDRYIILIIPTLAILACYNLVLLNQLKLNNKIKLFLYFLVYISILPNIVFSYITNNVLNQNDTRIQAIEWYENQKQFVLNETKVINLMRNVQFNANLNSIYEKNKLTNQSLNAIERYKLKSKNFKSLNDYFCLNINEPERFEITKNNRKFLNYINENNYKLIFISYFSLNEKPMFLYDKNNFKLIKKINPTNSKIITPNLRSRKLVNFIPINFIYFNSLGPTVEVYKIN